MRARKTEYDAVVAVMDKFVEAIHKSDSTIVAPYFVESAHLYGNAGGNIEQESISTLLRNIDGLGELGAGVNFRTDILALEETIAVACMLEENMGAVSFTNYFTLMKIGGEWKILIHAYNQDSDTL